MVLEAVVNCAPISRASIAKQTGLSKQTVSEIARKLEDGGWIQETGRTSGHVGRSAVTYEIVADAACIATVDLGGTMTRAAIADLSCKILAELSESTDERGGSAVIRQIARLCRGAAQKSGIGFERVKLAVVGVPGVPERETGRVMMAPNIAEFETLDVQGMLADDLGVEVILENDVNLAVLGEHWIGVGAGVDDLAYIKLGTGIGAGILVGGELVRGSANAAGELGFLPFGADPFETESLRVGALERVAASVGMRSRFQARTGRQSEVPEVFEAVNKGEEGALETLEETARYVARGIAAICAITNPAKVILGGSIGQRQELVERVRRLLPHCSPKPVEVLVSDLEAHAALVGGAAVGLNHLHDALFSGGTPGAEIALPPAMIVNFASRAQ